MKRSLLCLFLAAISFSVMAQIDDVINAPKSPNQKTFTKRVLNLVESIELSSIVDEMKADGVKTRQFKGKVSIDGKLIGGKIDEDGEGKMDFLHYEVELTSDGKVHVTAGLIHIKAFTGLMGTVDILSYEMDDGVDFRNVQTAQFNFTNVNLGVNLNREASSTIVQLKFGTKVSFTDKEDVTLDNGQIIHMARHYFKVDDKNYFSGSSLLKFVARLGVMVQQPIGNGTLNMEVMGSYQSSKRQKDEVNSSDYTRRAVYISPALSYSFPIAKGGTSIMTIGASANIAAYDRLNGISNFNYADANRQPFNASVKLNFGLPKKNKRVVLPSY